MEAGDQTSDDEVFIGEITEKEKRHPGFTSRRRTTLYFPGISRPDSTVSVFEEVTDDGTLIFSCENQESNETVFNKSAEEKTESSHATDRLVHVGSLYDYDLCRRKPVDLPSADITGAANGLSRAETRDRVALTSMDSDSDYCSVSDGSLRGSVGSQAHSAVTCADVVHISPNTSDDRKRKRCQAVSPKVRRVQLQSPHLLVSPVAHFPNLTTSSPVVKRHIACKGMSAPADSNTASPTSIPNLLLQSSESAFSRLRLKSPEREARCDLGADKKSCLSPSPVLKDFPENHNTPAKFMPLTPETQQLLPPMKRKISKRSPPDDFKGRGDVEQKSLATRISETETRKKHKSCDSIHSATESKAEETCMLNGGDVSCDRFVHSTELYGQISQPTRSLFAGGDAQNVKFPSVFVPETPDVKSCAKKYVRVRPATMFSQELEDDGEIVSSSQVTDETMASPKLLSPRNHNSVPAAPLSPLSSFLSKSSRTPPSKHFSALKFKQTAFSSPDLFSSPTPSLTLVEKSQSQPHQASSFADPVHSPVPGSKVSVKLRSCSKSLQPIDEDGTEVIELENITATGPCTFFDAVSELKYQGKQDCKGKPEYLAQGRRAASADATVDENKENESVVSPSEQLDTDRRMAPVSSRSNNHDLKGIPEAEMTDLTAAGREEMTDLTAAGREEMTDLTAAGREEEIAQSPKLDYQGMTFAHLHMYLQSGRKSPFGEPVQPGEAGRGDLPDSRYARSNSTDDEVDAVSREVTTRVNTLLNGEIRHALLDPASSPALLMDFPAPREATRVSWSESLALEEPWDTQPPPLSATTPRSILHKRPAGRDFPFGEEPPSPIVLTRRRQPRFPRLFSS
ncbi:uncharacterized protein [Littorina saxatilis]|uniref:Uncharacterized protein n=1 Tax=Littorina saxatilis TaxID=31220 RepID=A0AAN9BSV8_9CAEN